VVFDHHRSGPRDYEVILGDIRDATAMVELAAHCDGIIHLAAVLGTQETIFNPRPAAETNLVGGLNFLEAVSQYDLPGVYIAIGNHWMNNSYSISKTASSGSFGCSMWTEAVE
jgi:UDP-glucose 4-epimerase